MSSEMVARIIEIAVCVAPVLGVPLLAWRDPAHVVERYQR